MALDTQRDAIWRTVRKVASEILGIDADQLSLDVTLMDTGAQSLDFVDFIFRLERIYGIHIPRDYAMPTTYTLHSIVNIIHSCLENQTK